MMQPGARRWNQSVSAAVTNTLCSLLLGLLLIAGVALFIVWLSVRPHRPSFSVASFSISGAGGEGEIAFNVSDRNPNRHIGIYYDSAQASVRFYDALVASGPAFSSVWYQPNLTTAAITGVLAVRGPSPGDASWASFSAALRAGRLPLRLQLRATIRFRVNVFHSGRQRMYVNCDLLVGADGNLLPDSVGAPCDRYF